MIYGGNTHPVTFLRDTVANRSVITHLDSLVSFWAVTVNLVPTGLLRVWNTYHSVSRGLYLNLTISLAGAGGVVRGRLDSVAFEFTEFILIR